MSRLRKASTFPALPAELVCMITDELPGIDFGALRLVCRELEKRSRYVFGRRFFSSRKYLVGLSSGEIGAIRDKLAKLRFGAFIKDLGIRGVEYNGNKIQRHAIFPEDFVNLPLSSVDLGDYWPFLDSVARMEAVESEVPRDLNHVDALVRLFSHTPNLDDVMVCSSWYNYDELDTRDIDGILARLPRDVSHAPLRPPTFTTVLEALSRCDIKPVKLALRDDCCSLNCVVAREPLRNMTPLDASHRSALSKVKELALGVFEGFPDPICYGRIVEYITSCPSLEVLHIMTHLHHQDKLLGAKVLSQLGRSLLNLPPRLSTLYLQGLQVDASCLTAVLRKFSTTLRKLSIGICAMTNGGRWKPLLKFLRDEMTALQDLQFIWNVVLDGPTERNNVENADDVYFLWSDRVWVDMDYTGDNYFTASGRLEEYLGGGYIELSYGDRFGHLMLGEIIQEKGLRQALLEMMDAIHEPGSAAG
ncbi:hypothetical protein MPH_05014 [Macrophomina phaseolina MS6]|uniref:F-box domain-containing protein n=2 Tax=Macrophomina phaseolina TaxID=35725 RepID=K2SLW1_MACPH|nr:hypothetical protein MPH_05014 [Macrophomina phaseolina MS6]